MTAYGNSNDNISIVGQEPGALEALVKLTKSIHDSIKLETVGALWNLSIDEKNRESIAAVGGVEALVFLFFLFIPFVFQFHLSLCFLTIYYVRWHLQTLVQMHPQLCKRE